MKKFFEKHIKYIKQNNIVCEECGAPLTGIAGEVAHILPKSKFKSVSTNDNNILYLCGQFSSNQCHSKYDMAPLKQVKEMKIYPKVLQKFEELEPLLTEKVNIITKMRYNNERS